MQVEYIGNQILLLAERAIYIDKLKAIFIADAHFGKATHFRKAGIAVPSNIISHEINRLQHLIETNRPEKIYFLGDLFHSHLNNEWQLLVDFVLAHPEIEFILVKGNHDILPEINYQHSNFKVINEPLTVDKLLLSHHPISGKLLDKNPNLLHIHGHLHPGIKLKGKAKSFFNLPCFHFQKNQLVLPAFGKFTGLSLIRPKKVDKVYAVVNDSILEI